MNKSVFHKDHNISWCPGCGNFGILDILKETLAELELEQHKIVVVSGIGQAAKLPHYINTNGFNGLHGRALPPATAMKAVNPELTVIVTSGDGDIYGEGGNHFLHAVRRNPDITVIVHDNMVYGLTKGQASPTSMIGFKTPVQIDGVASEPFNPLAIAISLDCSFVSRAFCGDGEKTKKLFKKAIIHKGFSLVDVFQPCVTFNKINTFKWFKENTYYLDASYNPCDKIEAFRKACEREKFPLGLLYINENKKTFEENLHVYKEDKEPLFKRKFNKDTLIELMKSKR